MATDRALVRQMAEAPEPPVNIAGPKHVFILSGGIGAGKTTIVNRLKADFHFVSGSPADILKRETADILAGLLNPDFADAASDDYFAEMLEQQTKAKYRDLLVALGEFISNADPYFWGTRAVQVAAQEYETLAAAGIPSGVVFDSMRRPAEILAVKQAWPQAKHVHLSVSPTRQMDYLTNIIGLPYDKAEATLANDSEHWLDDMDGTDYDADYVLDASQGDELTWQQMMGVVVLMMDKTTLDLAASITEQSDAEG